MQLFPIFALLSSEYNNDQCTIKQTLHVFIFNVGILEWKQKILGTLTYKIYQKPEQFLINSADHHRQSFEF